MMSDAWLQHMRTTLTLDDDVASKLRAEARTYKSKSIAMLRITLAITSLLAM